MDWLRDCVSVLVVFWLFLLYWTCLIDTASYVRRLLYVLTRPSRHGSYRHCFEISFHVLHPPRRRRSCICCLLSSWPMQPLLDLLPRLPKEARRDVCCRSPNSLNSLMVPPHSWYQYYINAMHAIAYIHLCFHVATENCPRSRQGVCDASNCHISRADMTTCAADDERLAPNDEAFRDTPITLGVSSCTGHCVTT